MVPEGAQGTTGGAHETKMPHVGRSPRVHRSATLGPTVAPWQARDLETGVLGRADNQVGWVASEGEEGHSR